MFDEYIGKHIKIECTRKGKPRTIEGVLVSYCSNHNVHPNTLYSLNFGNMFYENVHFSKIIKIDIVESSANQTLMHLLPDFWISADDRSWQSCKDKFNNPFAADVENYSDCGTTNNRPRDLYVPPKKEIMKVKVQVIIEAAEKALVVATEKYRVKFDKSLTQYTADVEEFLATDFSNVANVIAPIFQGVRNDTPLIKQDLRILNALAESEVEVHSNISSFVATSDTITNLFKQYVVNQNA